MCKIGDKVGVGTDEDITRYLYPATLDEAIERWDSGRLLFSIELGGLGPGYEQAIQITGMELIRHFKSVELDW